MSIVCKFIHVAEPAVAILAGAIVLAPLIALRLMRGALCWWGGNAR